jgi:hypothetical protein
VRADTVRAFVRNRRHGGCEARHTVDAHGDARTAAGAVCVCGALVYVTACVFAQALSGKQASAVSSRSASASLNRVLRCELSGMSDVCQ